MLDVVLSVPVPLGEDRSSMVSGAHSADGVQVPGLRNAVSRDDMDEWAVVFIDGSGKVVRDYAEFCPMF